MPEAQISGCFAGFWTVRGRLGVYGYIIKPATMEALQKAMEEADSSED